MSMLEFGEWLYATSVSTAIRDATWIIPSLQSIHILAIAVVIGSALVTELRIAGVLATDNPVGTVLGRYLPWMKWALLILLLTGLLLVLAEPGRTLGSTVFWTKMVLVVAASLVTLRARRTLCADSRDAGTGAALVQASASAKGLAWLMVAIWCAIIFLGRFIAYI
ncbi:MAG: DUF6644 family protein [Alteraurantiacibacter sp.]